MALPGMDEACNLHGAEEGVHRNRRRNQNRVAPKARVLLGLLEVSRDEEP